MTSDRTQDVIVGIDLGTTNSLVAVCDAAGPRVVRDEEGYALVPSIVRYVNSAAGDLLSVQVGRAGLSQSPQPNAAHDVLVSSVKRLMGRSVHDAAADLPFLPYRVEAGERDSARVVRVPASTLRPAAYITPEEVSAHILAHLKHMAERQLGAPVRRAVITVPAYFDDAQRQATRTAGRLAGLEVVRIVPEPTAAALAYGIGLGRDAARNQPEVSHIAVYDLGGGTFDISVLRITPAQREGDREFYQVLATSGDTHLGGDDIDQLIVRHAIVPIDAASANSYGAIQLARRLKHALTEHESATIDGVTLTRPGLAALIKPLLDRTLRACEQALRDAREKGLPDGPLSEALDAIILVGGSTRMPAVREAVAAFFGITPYTAIDPDQAIALGASVQASILAGTMSGQLLLDVIPLSLGLETVGGAVSKLIIRNSPVPIRASEMFSTSVDNQTSIRLSVYQGEREMAADCRKLAEFHIRGIPPMPAGLPQLEVSFAVDANGILNVQALERRSGKLASLQVIPNHGLTTSDVDRIERESVIHAHNDMTRHRIADLISHSTLDISAIARALTRVRALLDPSYAAVLDERVATLQQFVSQARTDWSAVDPNAFQRAKESLDRDSMRLHEVAIAQSLRD